MINDNYKNNSNIKMWKSKWQLKIKNWKLLIVFSFKLLLDQLVIRLIKSIRSIRNLLTFNV